MRRIGEIWNQLFPAEQQRIVQLLIERVDICESSMNTAWREDGWIGLDPMIVAHPYVEESKGLVEEIAA